MAKSNCPKVSKLLRISEWPEWKGGNKLASRVPYGTVESDAAGKRSGKQGFVSVVIYTDTPPQCSTVKFRRGRRHCKRKELYVHAY